MRMRVVLLACLVTLVAVWVATTSTLPFGPGARVVPPALPAEGETGPLGALDLERAAERLRARVDASSRPTPPARNPFRFEAAPASRTTSPRASLPLAVMPEAPAVPSAPAITLVGVAEQTVDGETVRTAVVSMTQQLFYVKAGERIGTAYEVLAVGADSVDVKDLASGSARRVRQP
jgi:hypothetical protein